MNNNSITPHVTNETAPLKTVILGLPDSLGSTPTLEETYDATSYHNVLNGTYPTEADIHYEMESFAAILRQYGAEVLRPECLPNYNQIFARDVAFVVEDCLFIANMIADRSHEIEAFATILHRIPQPHIVHLPQEVSVEGGDVLLYDKYLFIGCCLPGEFGQYKTARTNAAAIEYFTQLFPHKEVIPLALRKHDTDPMHSTLHLDCAFQPVGKGKAVIYPAGFARKEDYNRIVDIFGVNNLFALTPEEAMHLGTNLFSISPEVIVSEARFHRLNKHLREAWGLTVEAIPYHEVSKQGGLLRCSTCPLVRG